MGPGLPLGWCGRYLQAALGAYRGCGRSDRHCGVQLAGIFGDDVSRRAYPISSVVDLGARMPVGAGGRALRGGNYLPALHRQQAPRPALTGVKEATGAANAGVDAGGDPAEIGPPIASEPLRQPRGVRARPQSLAVRLTHVLLSACVAGGSCGSSCHRGGGVRLRKKTTVKDSEEETHPGLGPVLPGRSPPYAAAAAAAAAAAPRQGVSDGIKLLAAAAGNLGSLGLSGPTDSGWIVAWPVGGMMEYSLIAKTIDMSLNWDGVAVVSIAALELLARRLQLIEEKYKHRLLSTEGKSGISPETDNSLYLGLELSSGFGKQAVCIMPELSEYVGTELAKEAAISKGKMKAYELREQLKKISKGGGKGKTSEE